MPRCLRCITLTISVLFLLAPVEAHGFFEQHAKSNARTCRCFSFAARLCPSRRQIIRLERLLNYSASPAHGAAKLQAAEGVAGGTSPAQTPPTSSQAKWAGQGAYVRITAGAVRVLEEISPDSRVLGLAYRESYYPVLAQTESWCKIAFGATPGWVEKRHLVFVDKPSSPLLRQAVKVAALVLFAAALLLTAKLAASRFDRLHRTWFRTIPGEKTVLIAARDDKQVQRYLAGDTILLEKCFSEIGFTVSRARDTAAMQHYLANALPDVMVVDRSLTPGAHHAVDHLLSSKAAAAGMLVIFYNIADPAGVRDSGALPNARYLGISFSDRELFALVTPHIIAGEKPTSVRESVKTAALEGGLADGSLQEVFQFVEIGRKTGCLLVEDKRPYGIVFFRQGTIVYAATSHSTGRQAVFEVLNLSDGRFRFVLDKEPASVNCTISTLGALMEWSKEIDEAHGH